jgi:hypothetical protein
MVDLRRSFGPASTSLVPYLGGSDTPAWRMEGWNQPRGRTVPTNARSAARRARSEECRTAPGRSAAMVRVPAGPPSERAPGNSRARDHPGRFRTTDAVERCVVAHTAPPVRRRVPRQSPRNRDGKFRAQRIRHYLKKSFLLDYCGSPHPRHQRPCVGRARGARTPLPPPPRRNRPRKRGAGAVLMPNPRCAK